MSGGRSPIIVGVTLAALAAVAFGAVAGPKPRNCGWLRHGVQRQLVPRLVQLVALWLALVVAGAPTWLVELAEDDCAAECVGGEAGGCEEQGCTDCSLVCSYCPRPYMVVPDAASTPPVAQVTLLDAAVGPSERVPVEPPARGVFHPPRAG